MSQGVSEMSSDSVVDTRNWMASPRVQAKQLNQITIPGTHDSGSYFFTETLAKNSYLPDWVEILIKYKNPLLGKQVRALIIGIMQDFATTGTQTVAQQLDGGVRYFDLRVTWSDDVTPAGVYMHHGLIGKSANDFLDDLAAFLGSVSKEFVVVNASHMKMTPAQHDAFLATIGKKLGPYLYNPTSVAEFQSTLLSKITATGPKVFFIYDDPYVNEAKGPLPAVWKNGDPYSTADSPTGAAGTNDINAMKDREQKGLEQHSQNDPASLYAVSWILTTQNIDVEKEIINRLQNGERGSLRKIVEPANKQLANFVKANESLPMNILKTDFYESSGNVQDSIRLSNR